MSLLRSSTHSCAARRASSTTTSARSRSACKSACMDSSDSAATSCMSGTSSSPIHSSKRCANMYSSTISRTAADTTSCVNSRAASPTTSSSTPSNGCRVRTTLEVARCMSTASLITCFVALVAISRMTSLRMPSRASHSSISCGVTGTKSSPLLVKMSINISGMNSTLTNSSSRSFITVYVTRFMRSRWRTSDSAYRRRMMWPRTSRCMLSIENVMRCLFDSTSTYLCVARVPRPCSRLKHGSHSMSLHCRQCRAASRRAHSTHGGSASSGSSGYVRRSGSPSTVRRCFRASSRAGDFSGEGPPPSCHRSARRVPSSMWAPRSGCDGPPALPSTAGSASPGPSLLHRRCPSSRRRRCERPRCRRPSYEWCRRCRPPSLPLDESDHDPSESVSPYTSTRFRTRWSWCLPRSPSWRLLCRRE
mmetsp:Transcript_19975/g.70682  ORF Transcript_19975/g.70682 Transcript_19975/m.70682 type:complete len:420 (-) Transcript_19975:505-1764(-)